MPFDLFHNLHEGLAVDVMSAMLRYLIDEQSSFLLSAEKRDLPQQLHKGKTMNNLIRLFPLLIGSYIPQFDVKWSILLSFTKLVQDLMSLEFSSAKIDSTAEHIEEFLNVVYGI